MRRIIMMMSVPVEGFVPGPVRDLDWHMVDELRRHSTGRFLSGRVTYEPSHARVDLRPAGSRTCGAGVILPRYERPGTEAGEIGDDRTIGPVAGAV